MHPQLLVARSNADLIGKMRRDGFRRLHRSDSREHKTRFSECQSSQFLEAGLAYLASEVQSRDFVTLTNDANLRWEPRLTTDEEVHRLAYTSAGLSAFGRRDEQLSVLCICVSTERSLAHDHLGEYGR